MKGSIIFFTLWSLFSHSQIIDSFELLRIPKEIQKLPPIENPEVRKKKIKKWRLEKQIKAQNEYNNDPRNFESEISQIRSQIEIDIGDSVGKIPSFSLSFGSTDDIYHFKSYGEHQIIHDNNLKKRMTPLTALYDLASISKLFTAVKIIETIDSKINFTPFGKKIPTQLFLDSKFCDILSCPKDVNAVTSNLTIEDLLRHNTNLPIGFAEHYFEYSPEGSVAFLSQFKSSLNFSPFEKSLFLEILEQKKDITSASSLSFIDFERLGKSFIEKIDAKEKNIDLSKIYFPLKRAFWRFIKHQIVSKSLLKAKDRKVRKSRGKDVNYTDLGMIFLGFILEEVYGTDLASIQESTFKKFKMNQSHLFSPSQYGITPEMSFLERVNRIQISRESIPTINIEPIVSFDTSFNTRFHLTTPRHNYKRKEVAPGEIHDISSRMAFHPLGNAGVFSTLLDLTKFAQHILKDIKLEKSFFKRMIDFNDDIPRGLGFDLRSPHLSYSSKGMNDENTFGHIGFTGTSFIINKKLGFFIIILSNAVKTKEGKKTLSSLKERINSVALEYIKNGNLRTIKN